jgi:diaminohydroxyphosphoribosylaminopyrimidine deaminase/5-amino-6-(5-phosphoribosylamino)uracil reductase
MRRAIQLARQAWGATHPNPLVGALLVEKGNVVAEGWHRQAGGAHAEINAMRALGRAPHSGATLVVTLEPCSTQGRTGACVDAIVNAGISRVVAGAADIFPAHRGRGFALLREAGVEVVEGVLARECDDLNLIFNHRVAHGGEPLVALKTASTLDGRIASRTGESRWITGAAARVDVMLWRRYFPALAVSAATVLADNPRLTSRQEGGEVWCPVRFVFDRNLRTAGQGGLYVFEDEFAANTIVVTIAGYGVPREERAARMSALERRGAAVWELPAGGVFFRAFKERCAAAGIGGVLVEGGGRFLGAWLESGEAGYLFHYTAPKLLSDAEALSAFTGGNRPLLGDAFTLREVRHAVFDPEGAGDFLTRGWLCLPPREVGCGGGSEPELCA